MIHWLFWSADSHVVTTLWKDGFRRCIFSPSNIWKIGVWFTKKYRLQTMNGASYGEDAKIQYTRHPVPFCKNLLYDRYMPPFAIDSDVTVFLPDYWLGSSPHPPTTHRKLILESGGIQRWTKYDRNTIRQSDQLDKTDQTVVWLNLTS